jgi:hypothetical protein
VTQMNEKFRLGKTIYIVIGLVFVFGILIAGVNSHYLLKYLPKGKVVEKEQIITKLSNQAVKDFKNEEYLLIYNDENPGSVGIKDNIIATLNYMKKNVTTVTQSNLPPSFDDYQYVIIAYEEIRNLASLDLLESYMEKGGMVLFAIRPELNGSLLNFYQKLGISEMGKFVTPDGLRLNSNVLIKQKHLAMKKEEITANSSLSVKLAKNCTIHMESLDQVPLLWEVPYKNGKFMVFNGTMLATKGSRGLIAGALSMLNENYLYPIMNMKVFYMDDFPAPIPKGKNKRIYDEYRRDIPSFYQDIWWPDIQKGAEKYDVKYTALAIQSYDDDVTPPFSVNYQERNTFIQFGRELLKMGGEIGVHGYNHQSLTVDPKIVEDLGYHTWKNQADMEESLNTVENFIHNLFPNYEIKTYVPPSNRIDTLGERAVTNALPTINVLSSLYLPDSEGKAAVHEFAQGDQFIYFPRLTSGYEYTQKKKWFMVNGVTSLGIVSHFIHPDDILDNERSFGKSWGELGQEYDRFLHEVHSDFPWLKSTTANNAGKQLVNYLNAEVFIKDEGDRIAVQIDRFPGEISFILRTNKKMGKLVGCEVQKVDEDVYFVNAKKASIEIGLVD